MKWTEGDRKEWCKDSNGRTRGKRREGKKMEEEYWWDEWRGKK